MRIRKVRYKPMDGLRQLREDNHLSQAKLGDIVGVGQGDICAYENGVAQPLLSTAIKLAKVLNCTVEELL